MCITYRFYHLCGHIHRNSTFSCTSTPNTSPTPPLLHPNLASSTEEIRLFPILCASCSQIGIISDWLAQTPGGRFEVVRAWGRMQRKGRELKGVIEEAEIFDDETVVESEGTAVEEEESHEKGGERRSKAGEVDVKGLTEMIAKLTRRMRKRIVELKNKKAMR